MKFIHTSDWHLGRLLYQHRRDDVFEKFLDWLLARIKEESVDLLIVSGDVFDTQAPSNAMCALYHDFLFKLSRTDCRAAVVVGGNHDSPSLLNTTKQVLTALSITVFGGSADPAEEIVPVTDKDGDLLAVVAAIPFIRERELDIQASGGTVSDREKRMAEATARHYKQAVESAITLRKSLHSPDAPIIATGHLFVAGQKKDEGMRDLYVGGLGKVPARDLPAEIDYLALGHIHKPCRVGGRSEWNYCGAPLIFDFSEVGEKRYVNLVETNGRACRVKPIEVPQFDTLKRIEGTPDELEDTLRRLAAAGKPVLCEAVDTSKERSGGLYERLRKAVEGSPVELLRVRVTFGAPPPPENERRVRDIDRVEMFNILLGQVKEQIKDEDKTILRQLYNVILNEIDQEDARAS